MSEDDMIMRAVRAVATLREQNGAAPYDGWNAIYGKKVADQMRQQLLTEVATVLLARSWSAEYRVPQDGFEGVQIGQYTTLEGKEGIVLQQVGTQVVHVYARARVEKI
jgi:hypothetical protein